MSYSKGQLVRLRVWFTDPENNDVRVQPTTVSIKVKDPNSSTNTYTPTLDASTTSYYYDLAVSTVGTWYYRGESTGGYQAAAEKSFTVLTSQF